MNCATEFRYEINTWNIYQKSQSICFEYRIVDISNDYIDRQNLRIKVK